MPDKLTDREIVKAKAHFEYGIKCDIFQEPVLSYAKTVLEAFDEINRLQAENKNLQERNVILRGLVDTQKAENERLKEPASASSIHILVENAVESENRLPKFIQEIKSEAYKEFAEKIKKWKYQSSDWSHGEHPFVIEESDIDEVLNELVGEDK